METQAIQSVSSQGPVAVVVALFLIAIYLIAKMVADVMRGYTKTQEQLIKQLESFSSTIRSQTMMLQKQTKMIEKQSVIITQLKEVIAKLYEELVRKAQIIKEYEDNRAKQAEIKKNI